MGQYDALFEAEPQVQSKYDALFEEEPTPTPAPATIRSEGQGPEPQETFLEKMKRLAQTPSYEWMQAPEQAARETLSGLVPHSLGQAGEMAAGMFAPEVQGIRDIYRAGKVITGTPVEEAIPESQVLVEAEKTPPFSVERWRQAIGIPVQLGMAALVGKGAFPREPLPTLPAKIDALREAQLKAAVRGPEPPPPAPEVAIAPTTEYPAPAVEATAPPTVTLYHATPKKFESFNVERATPTGLGGKAHYFSDKPETKAYGENVVTVEIPREKIADLEALEKDPAFRQGGNIDELLKSQGYEGTYNSASGEYTIYDPNKFVKAVEPTIPEKLTTIEEPSYAPQIEEPRTLPQPEIRTRVGEETPLRGEPERVTGEEAVEGGGATSEVEAAVGAPEALRQELASVKRSMTKRDMPDAEWDASLARIKELEQQLQSIEGQTVTSVSSELGQRITNAESESAWYDPETGSVFTTNPTPDGRTMAVRHTERTSSFDASGFEAAKSRLKRLRKDGDAYRTEAATPEAEAAVVKVEHGEYAKPGYTAVPTEELPVTPKEEVVIPEGERGYAGFEPPTTPPVSEAVPGGPEPVTGISKAAIAEQRGARGAPDIDRQKQLDFGQSIERAKTALVDDPAAGERLIQNFMEKARPIATEEVPLAIEQLQKVQREFDAATEAVNKATPDELPYAQDRLNNARTQYDLTTEAVQNATSATGAGLNSVKMLLKDDFSLARMEQVARAVINDGKPLSPKQTADVAKLHKRLQVAETKIAGYEAQDAFRAALKEAKAQEKAGFRVTDFMDRQAQAARDRIVARRGKLYADPLGVTNVAHLADEAIIGAAHITRGVTRFADWSAAMLREFGENIKPYLKGLYAKAKELAGNTAKGKLTPEEREARALAGEKKRIRTLTGKMRERMVKRDISPLREKREPRMDEEKEALLYEREKVKKDYREMLAVEALKRAPWYKKAGRVISEPIRAIRSLKFSFDASALMQQGGFETFGHPIAQAKRVMPMLRAMRSDAGQFKVMNEIRNLPEWKSGEFRQAGVEFGDIDTVQLTKREEVFASRLAQKVPGVKMSERAFVTLLNQIRAQRYMALKNDLFGGGLFRKGGELTLNEKKILGNFVNVTTGRGNLGPFKQATQLLNAIFAAPRLRTSNFQLMLGQPIWHKLGSGSGRVRALMVKEYAKSLGGIGLAVAAASQIPGVNVELDSRSTDFGQIRIGNLRINPFSRLTSTGVLASRLITGKTKTQKGEIKPIYGGEVPYGGTTGLDVATRYLRGGLTPVIGGIVSGATGEMVTGEPTTPLKELTSAPTPLSLNNLSDALKAENVPPKIIAGILSATGMGVGYYGPRTGAGKKAEAARLSARDKALLHGDVQKAYELSFRPLGEEVEGGTTASKMRYRMIR